MTVVHEKGSQQVFGKRMLLPFARTGINGDLWSRYPGGLGSLKDETLAAVAPSLTFEVGG